MEAGLEFEDRVIDIRSGEQNSDSYRRIHPYGTVPALSVDSEIITENVAILLYIDSIKPGILFPETENPVTRATYQADLVWCTAALHPFIRQVRMPMRFTDGDVSGVREKGLAATRHIFNILEERFADNKWWYGDKWSILDVYVNWAIMTAASTDLIAMDGYPNILSHIKRVRQRPVFKAALKRQTKAKERAGLTFPDEANWNTNIG
jgi:glutathione S-transferase